MRDAFDVDDEYELAVQTGEEVTIIQALEREPGLLLCMNAAGAVGKLPAVLVSLHDAAQLKLSKEHNIYLL